VDIVIKESKLQFKNPETGKPTKAVKEHYISRRIVADVDGREEMIRLKSDELKFNASEEDMIRAIENNLSSEK